MIVSNPSIVSIVVVNWNTRELLRRCLTAVQNTLNGLEAELIVVDNASADGSAQMVRQDFPQFRLIQNQENVGFARANNQAIRESEGRYILLLNSDAFMQGNAIGAMANFMDAHPDAGIVGANLRFPDGKPQWSHGPLPTLAGEVSSLLGLDKLSARQAKPHASYVSTGTVSGACLMARRSMLEEVGLLDEGFFMFSEEVDLCFRAHRAGWKVYHLPHAHVVHVGGGSTGLTADRLLMLYRGKAQYFSKNSGTLAAWFFVTAMRLTAGLKWLVYRLSRILLKDGTGRDHLWRAVSKGLAQMRNRGFRAA